MDWFISLRANPLVIRSLRQPARLPARRILTFSVRIALFVTAVCLAEAALRREVGLTMWMLLSAAIMLISTPPFVAYTASNLTLHELRSQQYELLHITALSNARLVQGYLFSALYRCRYFLLLIAGFMPFLIFSAMVYAGYMRCFINNYLAMVLPGCWPLPLPEEPALWLVNSLLIFVCLAGIILLSAVLGVLLAVLLQVEILANLGSLMTPLVGTVTAAWWVIGPPWQPLHVTFERALLLCAGVYLAAFLLMRFARPFARRRV